MAEYGQWMQKSNEIDTRFGWLLFKNKFKFHK